MKPQKQRTGEGDLKPAPESKRMKPSVVVLRRAVADYMATEGCSCCRDIDGHEKAKGRLAKMLGVPRYGDDSGWGLLPIQNEETALKPSSAAPTLRAYIKAHSWHWIETTKQLREWNPHSDLIPLSEIADSLEALAPPAAERTAFAKALTTWWDNQIRSVDWDLEKGTGWLTFWQIVKALDPKNPRVTEAEETFGMVIKPFDASEGTNTP